MGDRTVRLSISWVSPASLATLCACAGGDARSHVTVRDSAGIVIVENADAPVQHWVLSDSPEVRIGVLDGPEEEQLFDVRGAVRLPDGRIAVGNSGTGEVRFFDAMGKYIGATGHSGEGPGEFRSVSSVHLSGDSLLVSDLRLDRVSVLSIDGTFVRSFPIPRRERSGFPMFEGGFDDGSLLLRVTRMIFGRPGGAVLRDTLTLYRMSRDGMILDSLGTFPGVDLHIDHEGGRPSVTLAPFGRAARIIAAGNRFYQGDGEGFEIEVHDAGGALERLVRLDKAPRPVTPDDIERAKSELLTRADRDARFLEQLPFPSIMPAYSDFNTDAENNLWVGAFRPLGAPGDEPRVWTVFDEEGATVANVVTPTSLTIFDIGPNWVLGKRTDEWGIEHVELYGLQKAAS